MLVWVGVIDGTPVDADGRAATTLSALPACFTLPACLTLPAFSSFAKVKVKKTKGKVKGIRKGG